MQRFWSIPAKSKCFAWPILAAVAAIASSGCQVHVGGQTLPSPYYQADDVQYFPPGNEFKLANEAAALQARQAALPPVVGDAGAAPRPGWTQPKWR